MSPEIVGGNINLHIWASPLAGGLRLDDAVLGLPAESTVGAAVIDLLKQGETVLALLIDPDTGGENEAYEPVRHALLRQCAIWYFG